jgi:hypothetical protein
MVIDPTEEFALVELERIKWFLSNVDLTKNEDAGSDIQDAYNSIADALRRLRTRA